MPPTQTPGLEAEPAPSAMRRLLRRIQRLLRMLLAFILILIGAIFVVTPFIPGWPLMVIGLSMLAVEFAWARRLLTRLPKRRPRRERPKPPP